MIKVRVTLALVGLAFLVSGCAGTRQARVDLTSGHAPAKGVRIGVAMAPLPKLDTHLPGAGCLLCIAVAAATNLKLTNHTRTLPYEGLPKLKSVLAEAIQKKGADVTIVDEALDIEALPDFEKKGSNIARKDFSSVQRKHAVDKLVVIHVEALGMIRPYAGYIPNGEPKALLRGTGFMVNLGTNEYEWFFPVELLKSADGMWDEPPQFPGLTNAYFQVLEMGKDSFLKPFSD